jgi:hypothetical protein
MTWGLITISHTAIKPSPAWTHTVPCGPAYINKGSLAESGAQDAIT